jgi:hypothetical protein
MTKKQHGCRPHPPYFLCFPDWKLNWKDAILIQLRWSMQNLGQCWTPSQNTTPGCIYKMVETLGTVNTRGRELLRWWLRPVGSKLVFLTW